MANRRIRSQPNTKQATAKQALKKKQKSVAKFKNEQLRESLDCQVQAVYLAQRPKAIPSSPTSLQPESVNDLLTGIAKM